MEDRGGAEKGGKRERERDEGSNKSDACLTFICSIAADSVRKLLKTVYAARFTVLVQSKQHNDNFIDRMVCGECSIRHSVYIRYWI